LKLRVEEPHWIELSRETNKDELDEQLRNYMLAGGKIRHPTMVVFLLQKESSYQAFKEVMH
jgi:hypothetical protein